MLLITEINCQDCKKDFQFDEKIEYNKTNLLKSECENYSLSFIKKTLNNKFEFTVIFNCKQCQNNITKIFKAKEENNYCFKCRKCNLKGLFFSYFLSIEENSPFIQFENNNENIDEDSNLQLINKNFNNEEVEKCLINKENNVHNYYSDIDKNKGNLGKADSNPMNIKSEPLFKKKEYSTPFEITIIFVKNDIQYEIKVIETDIIRRQTHKIKAKISDLGPNPQYYYNGRKLDINKTFKENQVFNRSYLEIED